MKHEVPHDLDEATARKATEAVLKAYADRFADYEPCVTWRDDRCAEVTFKAKGIKLGGLFELVPGAVRMDMEVPFLLKPFRKKALEVVEEEIKAWVERARRGTI